MFINPRYTVQLSTSLLYLWDIPSVPSKCGVCLPFWGGSILTRVCRMEANSGGRNGSLLTSIEHVKPQAGGLSVGLAPGIKCGRTRIFYTHIPAIPAKQVCFSAHKQPPAIHSATQ